MKKILVFSFCLFFMVSQSFCQDRNEVVTNSKNTIDIVISAKAGGATFMSAAIDVYLFQMISLELVLIPTGYGLGTYFHFNPLTGNKNWSPYIGVAKGQYTIRLFDKYHFNKLYFPVGMNYYSKTEKLNIAIDIGLIQTESYNDGYALFSNNRSSISKSNNGLSASLKVGLRFGK